MLSIPLEKLMKLSKVFITGCDHKTQWQLPWFFDNLKRFSKTKLVVYDFGMSEEMKRVFAAQPMQGDEKGWFKKPKAMIEASKIAKKVCWLDTDCQVLGPVDEIFDYVEPNKLAMAQDVPWSKRREETWHNSGVVAFQNRPNILDEWYASVKAKPKVGDQEVLHDLVKDGMRRSIHITDLPRKYNTLRLDIIDGSMPKDHVIMHWTGAKGKIKIEKMIKESQNNLEYDR
jgi:hypothetical protein